ncbi:MAG: outer membrane beta-barrel protein [Candidatus Neomarinimicrobiota bacterium]
MYKLIIVAIFFCSSLYSQGESSSNIFSLEGLRITGGFAYSNVGGDYIKDQLDDIDGLKFKYVPGLSFGLEKDLPMEIIGGITYTKRGTKVVYKDADFDFKEESTNTASYLTLYIVKSFPVGGFEIFGGGEAGTFWKGKYKYKQSYAGESYSDTETYDREEWQDDLDGKLYDFGLIGGITFPINQQFAIQGSYYFGFLDVFEDEETRSRSFKVVVIYIIG